MKRTIQSCIYFSFFLFYKKIIIISGDSILLTQKEKCPKKNSKNLSFLRGTTFRGLSQRVLYQLLKEICSKPKIRRSFCLQSFLFWLIIDFFYARYLVIFVPPFKFIVVIIMSFQIVSKKLFSHSNHVSLLVSNLAHQGVRVFCSHLMKVNLDKRLIHSVSYLQT